MTKIVSSGWYTEEYDDNGNPVRYEDSEGYWWIKKYDINNNPVYFEDSKGSQYTKEYDCQGNLLSYKDSEGGFRKYDINGNIIYYEISDGGNKMKYVTMKSFHEDFSGFKQIKEYDRNGDLVRHTWWETKHET